MGGAGTGEPIGFANGFALVVGIGTYRDSAWNAPPTFADGNGIADALSAPDVAGYPTPNVQFLHDAGAGLDAILKGFDRLADVAGPDDTALIFYAGHGLVHADGNGEYYLTAHDTTFVGRDLDPATGMSETVLLQKLLAIEAKKLVLVLNACFAGEIAALPARTAAAEPAVGTAPSQNLSIRVLGTGEGRAVITACRATQKSWYKPGTPTTYFGEAVTTGLEGAGSSPQARYVGLFDLYEHVYETTKRDAAGLPSKPLQEPVLNLTQGVGPFPLALASRAARVVTRGSGEDEAALDAPMKTTLPVGMAATYIDQKLVDAARSYLPGVAIDNRDYSIGKTIDQSVTNTIDNRRAFDLRGANVRSINVRGDVAAGDIIKISIGATPGAAAKARTEDEVRTTIDSVRAEVGKLSAADPIVVKFVGDLLDGATDASEKGDRAVLLDRLDKARGQLLELGSAVPAAVPISETLAVLVQRASSISDVGGT
jgi:hypothetical protein